MDKLDEAMSTSKNPRYSIPALLWIGYLCQTNKTPFDLSRLSFAVFHAGFVKQSAACASRLTLPLQDTSINRNRGWSLDTASSAEDNMISSGSGKHRFGPRRQPVNAPGSPGSRIQADEGFVRFLKTHSSPTHQRVTAGGRIVPMEPPSAPPQFKLLIGNSSHGSIAQATHNIGQGSIRREQYNNDCSTTKYSEHKTDVRKLLNADDGIRLSQNQHLLAEPFPKFYDGQTGPQDNQKAGPDNDKAVFSRNKGTERKLSQLACQVLGTGQNTAHPVSHGLEKQLPTSTISEDIVAQPRHSHSHVTRSNLTGHAYANPEYPIKMPDSQQQAPITSQYIPYTTPPLLDGVSTAMAPDLCDNSQVLTRYLPATEIGTYPGLGLGANQTILYPSLFPMVSQGFQVPQVAGLPLYANQLSYVPTAYYTTHPYNQSTSVQSALTLQSSPDTSLPLADGSGLNAGISEAPNRLQLQQELVLAEARFNHFTEQERTLDQYLAMNMDTLDLQARRACTGNRMRIVEERAAAKDRMNQVQRLLNAEITHTMKAQSDCQPLTSLRSTTQNRPSNRLNVQAPSWVPKAITDGNKAIKIQNPNKPTSTVPVTTLQKAHISPADINGSKATPLQPTETVSDDPFSVKSNTFIFSPEKSPVDEWGARLGAAPPELERQQSEQSELLESMASEASRASPSPQRSADNLSEPDSGWHAKEGYAPPQVEADHEKYLDTIRKDLGTASSVTPSNGKTLKVEGRNYKQPKIEYMSSEFEEDYWLRKPNPDQGLGDTRSRPLECAWENIKRTPSPSKSKQTQDWVNGVVELQKPRHSGHAPWISEGMNLLSRKGEPSISLQDTHAMSKTKGVNGAEGQLRRRY